MNIRFFKNTIWRLAALFLSAVVCTPTSADEIPIVNRTKTCVTVWLWDGNKPTWNDQIVIAPQARVVYAFDNSKSYFVTVRPRIRGARTVDLGWINLTKLRARPEFSAIAITDEWKTQVRHVTCTVTKPVWETLTRSKTIYRRRLIDGIWRSVPETIEEEYKVAKMVPEQRVKRIEVRVHDFEATASDGVTSLFCLATFKTIEPGAFVRLQLAGRKDSKFIPDPTITTTKIPVGTYIVWTEREDHPTSSRNRYDLYEKDADITIPEH
jgi:hypothetical protein